MEPGRRRARSQGAPAQRDGAAGAGPAGGGRRPVPAVPAPHGPALALPAAVPLRAHLLPRQRVRPRQPLHGSGEGVQAVSRLLRRLDAARHQRQGLRDRPVRRRHRLHGRRHRGAVQRARRARHPRRHHRGGEWRPRRDAVRARVLVRSPRPVRQRAARAADPALPAAPAGRGARGRLQPAPGPGADAAGARPGCRSTTRSSTAAACCRWCAARATATPASCT